MKNKVSDETHPTTTGDEEDLFWMNDNNEQQQQPKSQLTSRLQHVKTLEEELHIANDRCTQQQQKEKKEQIKAQVFSLKPNPSHLIDEEETAGRQAVIDGDQWTFAGQHYILHERG